jgi:N-acetylglucosamine malate deacetylase 1
MLLKQRVLVVAAHPDDEMLGCGASIAQHALDADEVHVLILGEGLTSRRVPRDQDRSPVKVSDLANCAKKANDLLGVSSLQLKGLPDNRLDSIQLLEIIQLIEESIDRLQPEIVYTHYSDELNIDHRRVHEAVVTACRPVPQSCVKTLLFFEIPSSTEWQTSGSSKGFMPNWFNDVSFTLEKKLLALACYESEIRPWPHPRSIKGVEHLARWRGATVGVEAAEAFVLGRAVRSRDAR